MPFSLIMVVWSCISRAMVYFAHIRARSRKSTPHHAQFIWNYRKSLPEYSDDTTMEEGRGVGYLSRNLAMLSPLDQANIALFLLGRNIIAVKSFHLSPYSAHLIQ